MPGWLLDHVKDIDAPLPREFPGAIWYDEEEVAAVTRVVKARSPFRYYGPGEPCEAREFEREFARFIANKPGGSWPDESPFTVTAVNSGTGALEVALEALGVSCGDEVCVQGFMWIATISAIVRCRAVPVLVDSDATLNMDPGDLRRKITDRTRVVIPVPMLGCCCRIGEIMDVVREANASRASRGLPPVRVLEDCAQAVGAHATGAPGSIEAGARGTHRVGTFGDIGIFSMQINKNFTAGEGGIIVTADPGLAKRVEAIHNVGFAMDRGQSGNWYGDEPVAWGQGRRITEMQAALGRVQLARLDGILARMRRSHDRIERHLQSIHGLETRARAYPDNPGDTGYFCTFLLPVGDDEATIMARGRALHAAIKDAGLVSLYMHDFEVHVYFNITQLVEKWPVTGGCPWACPANVFHHGITYGKGKLPVLDDLLVRSIGINVPSALDEDGEQHVMAVLDRVLGAEHRTTRPRQEL